MPLAHVEVLTENGLFRIGCAVERHDGDYYVTITYDAEHRKEDESYIFLHGSLKPRLLLPIINEALRHHGVDMPQNKKRKLIDIINRRRKENVDVYFMINHYPGLCKGNADFGKISLKTGIRTTENKTDEEYPKAAVNFFMNSDIVRSNVDEFVEHCKNLRK